MRRLALAAGLWLLVFGAGMLYASTLRIYGGGRDYATNAALLAATGAALVALARK